MKYIIETTDNGCIETLELSDGTSFSRRSERTEFGCRSIDDDFNEQMERNGISEELCDAAYDLFDGFGCLDFLRMSEMDD